MKKIDLENNRKDLIVSIGKSVIGIIPFAGPLLTEIIVNLIPNQRVDRLSKYIKELDEKFALIPAEKINNLLNNEKFIDLIEEGFTQASRAISNERRKYIAAIVANGISEEKINLEESKYLLHLLQELNDIEIIWLRSFIGINPDNYKEFRDKHKNILEPISVSSSLDQSKALLKSIIQDSYKEHLERLELIERKIKINRQTRAPEIDQFKGKPLTFSPVITQLGRLLLNQIGLIDDSFL